MSTEKLEKESKKKLRGMGGLASQRGEVRMSALKEILSGVGGIGDRVGQSSNLLQRAGIMVCNAAPALHKLDDGRVCCLSRPRPATSVWPRWARNLRPPIGRPDCQKEKIPTADPSD